MDHGIELRFQKLKTHLEESFREEMEVQAMLFLIGVNELGLGQNTSLKTKKLIYCTLQFAL